MEGRRRSSVECGSGGLEGGSGGARESVRVWLLGGFRVSVGDRIIEEDGWSLRKAGSLVKLLSLAPGHRLHREQVMDALWPDLPPKSAANNLHRTLHAARRTFGPDAARSLLVLRDERLSLCPDGEVLVDVGAFEDAAKAARANRDPAAYQTAVDLYAGDLLPGDLYEEWAEERREALRNAHLDLLVELGALREEREEYGAAVETLRRVVDAEPAREEANAALMRLYARSGRRRAALEQYESLTKALRGGQPEEETRRLHEEIRAERFPPLSQKTNGGASSGGEDLHNLPAYLTSFVGREAEVVEVKRALAMNRMVTLTGAGGSGKTRLALEVAGDLMSLYPDGVWLVELAPLAEESLVSQEVSRVLRVHEKPDRPLDAAISDELRSKNLLLVLDNCEHLVEEVARQAETLLKSCPNLRVLATSREALGIWGEARVPVPPLALPDPGKAPEEIERAESARLFVERAGSRGLTFALTPRGAESVARICRRLDGIPLAIELAAARVGILSVEQIFARLEDSLALLTSGSRTATPRQKTLEGALDWGHDLLSEPEKRLFARLSAFAGGWTLEAAEAVGSGEGGVERAEVLDLLAALVEKSLVVADASPEEGVLRYGMLETVRQYASGKLQARGETEDVRSRHAGFFLDLAEEAEPKLQGPEHEVWLERLDTEHDNLRAALRWAVERGASETGLRLAGALGDFWMMRGYLAECRGWLDAVSTGGEARTSAHFGKVLYWAGHLAREQGDYERAEDLGEESLKLARGVEDEAAVANALHNLGLLALYQNSYEKASECFEEALEIQRGTGDEVNASLTLQALGSVAVARRDYARAAELHEEALSMARRIGDPVAIGFAIGMGTLISVGLGDHERAKSLRAEGLGLAARAGHERFVVLYLHASAMISVSEGRLPRAARLWGAAEALQEVIGSTISPLEEQYFAPYISATREGLEDPETPWAEGRRMTKDEAAAYALSEEDDSGEEEAAAEQPLSKREREVAELVAKGLTNRRISEELYISKRTVDNHVRNILAKLGLDSREEVADRFPED